MADPTKKAPGLEGFLEALAKTMGSPLGRVASIKNNVCVSCNGPAREFKDSVSKQEYRLTGFCQACQDKTFG